MLNKLEELDYSLRTEYKYHNINENCLFLTNEDENKNFDKFIKILIKFIDYQNRKNLDIIDLRTKI